MGTRSRNEDYGSFLACQGGGVIQPGGAYYGKVPAPVQG